MISLEGRVLRELREERALTQKDLAAKAGLNPATIGEVERGRRKLTSEVLVELLVALEVEPFNFCTLVAALRTDELEPFVAEALRAAGKGPLRRRRAAEVDWALGVLGAVIQGAFFGVVARPQK